MHACCFITHMIKASLAENRDDRIKGKGVRPWGGRFDGLGLSRLNQAQNVAARSGHA